MDRECDLVIVGGGLAGLTAALFAGRLGLAPVVVMDYMIGGQILNIPHVSDYPGFPDGVAGHELGPLASQQAEAAGAEIVLEEAVAIEAGIARHRVETIAGSVLYPRALILAMGSSLRKLGVPGEAEFEGRGVSSCASCDGPLFSGKRVLVVGGGDSALLEAPTLAEYGAQVLLIHRGASFSGQVALRDAVESNPAITVRLGTELASIEGDQTVSRVTLRSGDATSREDVAGVFVYAGLEPKTAILSGIPLDGGGHAKVDLTLATEAPGVFAAGDVREHSARQLVAAAGDGATAAFSAARYLASSSS